MSKPYSRDHAKFEYNRRSLLLPYTGLIPKSQDVDDLLIGFYQLGADKTDERDQVAMVGFRQGFQVFSLFFEPDHRGIKTAF